MHNIFILLYLGFHMRIQSKANRAVYTLFLGEVKYHSDGTDIQVHLAEYHPQITVVKEKKDPVEWSVMIIKHM